MGCRRVLAVSSLSRVASVHIPLDRRRVSLVYMAWVVAENVQ